MAQLKDLIVNGPSRFIGDVYATTFTGNLAGNATSATSASSAGNASTVAGLSVHSGRNNEANKIVRTDGNGYLQVGYINSSSGWSENNNSSPDRVWGSNASDSYLRTYRTSALSVGYATNAGTAVKVGNALTVTLNGGTTEGTNKFTYDGSGVKSLNITPSIIGAANASHTHNYIPITGGVEGEVEVYSIMERTLIGNPDNNSYVVIREDMCGPDADNQLWLIETGGGAIFESIAGKLVSSLAIKLNGGTTEGTNLFTFNNSASKTINITPSAIGAAAASHTHSYLPLSGGTMSNTNVVTNLNADFLDGCHAASFYQQKSLRSDQNSIYDLRFNYGTYDKGDFNGTYKDEYPTNYGAYLALTYASKNIGALMFFDAPTNNVLGHIYVRTRGAGDGNTIYSKWGTLAYLTDNVASSSKWATPRTITLTGSVTGSVSIDGSGDVSLATTTNHTHTFASLTSKPTTISGYGITDGLRRVTLANNIENDFNTFENLTLTGRGDPASGSSLLNSPWTTQPAGGFGVLTYLWSSYGLQLAAGYNSNDLYVRNKYFSAGIGPVWSTRWDKILNSSNYNSYAPKLDGTGASGTWGINISGNAATSTNADTLDGYHATYENNKPYGSIPVITEQGWMDVGKQFEFHYDNTTGSDYSTLLRCTGNYGNVIDLPSASGTLALTTDNVASASKLATSRTIWGQSFDGTGNVSGSLTGSNFLLMDRASNPYLMFTEKGLNGYVQFFGGTIAIGPAYDKSLVVDNNGNVGIGTTSPSYTLHVIGTAYASTGIVSDGPVQVNESFVVDGTNGGWYGKLNIADEVYILGEDTNINFIESLNIKQHNTTNNTETSIVSIDNSGNITLNVMNDNGGSYEISTKSGSLGIGIPSNDPNLVKTPSFLMSNRGYIYLNASLPSSPSYPLVVNGTIQCTTLSQTSDIKYKSNIKQIEYEEALKIIENLNPVTWDWNENTVETGSSSGFVAQEVEEFIPNAISRDNENNLSLDYTQLHSYEIRVIQEQQKEIIKLKEKLKILENLIS